MQASNGNIITTIIVSALVILLALVYVSSTITQPDEIAIPTASEIASLIVIPAQDNSANQLQQEIWDGVYEVEVNDLTNGAERECANEFDWNDVEDLFTDAHSVRFEYYDEDDREDVISNLGLNDEDDREITMTGYFTVSYIPDEGQQTRVNDKVYGECVVTSDEGDLEADLVLNL